ncbi:uncharacterized protein EV420DRAFT_1485884 [Desarmillaria tabescens]|uniref:Uncharacterized protein n=1 Tax=Armillaria tabescens TaxID=1929756 RepID=A0AA39JDB1_ARMTA|nr:uncharacterized protein EV420DRAFT_1485884 [Desarmillaria tabescens]KAK0440676.1 hypothetical protein EV420DRAFT_1485884 [Desarmillaria tabescens]
MIGQPTLSKGAVHTTKAASLNSDDDNLAHQFSPKVLRFLEKASTSSAEKNSSSLFTNPDVRNLLGITEPPPTILRDEKPGEIMDNYKQFEEHEIFTGPGVRKLLSNGRDHISIMKMSRTSFWSIERVDNHGGLLRSLKSDPQFDHEKSPSTTQDADYLIGYPWHANSCWLDSSLEALFWTFMRNWPEVETVFRRATSDSHGFSMVYRVLQARRSMIMGPISGPIGIVSSQLKSQRETVRRYLEQERKLLQPGSNQPQAIFTWFANVMNITSKIKKSRSLSYTDTFIMSTFDAVLVIDLISSPRNTPSWGFKKPIFLVVGASEKVIAYAPDRLPLYDLVVDDQERPWNFPRAARVAGLLGREAVHRIDISDFTYDMTARIFRGIHGTHHFVTRFVTSRSGAGNHEAAFFYDGLVRGGRSRREEGELDSLLSGSQPKLPVTYSGFQTCVMQHHAAENHQVDIIPTKSGICSVSFVGKGSQHIPIAERFWLDPGTLSTLEKRSNPPLEYFFSQDSPTVRPVRKWSVGELNRYPLDESYEEAIDIYRSFKVHLLSTIRARSAEDSAETIRPLRIANMPISSVLTYDETVYPIHRSPCLPARQVVPAPSSGISAVSTPQPPGAFSTRRQDVGAIPTPGILKSVPKLGERLARSVSFPPHSESDSENEILPTTRRVDIFHAKEEQQTPDLSKKSFFGDKPIGLSNPSRKSSTLDPRRPMASTSSAFGTNASTTANVLGGLQSLWSPSAELQVTLTTDSGEILGQQRQRFKGVPFTLYASAADVILHRVPTHRLNPATPAIGDIYVHHILSPDLYQVFFFNGNMWERAKQPRLKTEGGRVSLDKQVATQHPAHKKRFLVMRGGTVEVHWYTHRTEEKRSSAVQSSPGRIMVNFFEESPKLPVTGTSVHRFPCAKFGPLFPNLEYFLTALNSGSEYKNKIGTTIERKEELYSNVQRNSGVQKTG